MNSSIHPIVSTAVVFVILMLAGFASLYVLDVMPRTELWEYFVKTSLVLGIVMVASLGILGVIKMARGK